MLYVREEEKRERQIIEINPNPRSGDLECNGR